MCFFEKKINGSKNFCCWPVINDREGREPPKKFGKAISSSLMLDMEQSNRQQKLHVFTIPSLAIGITLHDVFEFVFAGSHIYSWETTGGCCDNFTAKL